MTAAQIIIISILFIWDFYMSVWINIYKIHKFELALAQSIRISLVYVLLGFTVMSINVAYKQAQGKCPEYERIENVYKLKQ